jgi:hypothetical protein
VSISAGAAAKARLSGKTPATAAAAVPAKKLRRDRPDGAQHVQLGKWRPRKANVMNSSSPLPLAAQFGNVARF